MQKITDLIKCTITYRLTLLPAFPVDLITESQIGRTWLRSILPLDVRVITGSLYSFKLTILHECKFDYFQNEYHKQSLRYNQLQITKIESWTQSKIIESGKRRMRSLCVCLRQSMSLHLCMSMYEHV